MGVQTKTKQVRYFAIVNREKVCQFLSSLNRTGPVFLFYLADSPIA